MAYLDRQTATHGDGLSESARSERAWSEFTASNRVKRLALTEHEAVFFEGDRAERLFEITDGAVMLYKLLPDGRRQVVEILGEGSLFGLQASDLYDCSAETLTPVRLRAIDRHDLEAIPDLLGHINQCLLGQLQTMHDHAVLLGRKSAFERVTSFLMRFVPKRGEVGCAGPAKDGPDEKVVVLAMTRQEIADYLGLTIETVSRVFSDLRRRGLIAAEKHDRVRILDICGLCKLTGTH
ncbi:MAG TPA: helix-turn-helix domain-containing protein [Hyphomicrobiales bacterium]|nr:helix-turn-helix domain-containing protein [Hyphomicrobiales bacterium]